MEDINSRTPKKCHFPKRLHKTPLILGFTAASLFGDEPSKFMTPAVTGPNISGLIEDCPASVDMLYLDQCHSWFQRETRSRTPKPQSLIRTVIDRKKPKKPRKKKQSLDTVFEVPLEITEKVPSPKALTPVSKVDEPISEEVKVKERKKVRSRLYRPNDEETGKDISGSEEPSFQQTSCPPDSDVNQNKDQEKVSCVACTTDRISEITSRTFFKLLGNNVGICPPHRLLTHRILDYKDHEVDDFWQLEYETDSSDSIPFTVNEDRRLREGVLTFGELDFEKILQNFIFAPSRTETDLANRWVDLKKCLL